ncbi:hypothetical protein THAOC_26472, partial [Thalassiosira oceanica]
GETSAQSGPVPGPGSGSAQSTSRTTTAMPMETPRQAPGAAARGSVRRGVDEPRGASMSHVDEPGEQLPHRGPARLHRRSASGSTRGQASGGTLLYLSLLGNRAAAAPEPSSRATPLVVRQTVPRMRTPRGSIGGGGFRRGRPRQRTPSTSTSNTRHAPGHGLISAAALSGGRSTSRVTVNYTA